MWRKRSSLFLAVLAALPVWAERYEAVEPHMGTLVRITLYASSEDLARQGFQRAFSRIRELDVTLSDYKPDSEVNRLCRARPGSWIAISDDLFRVLSVAQEYARATQGAFDVTVGALTHGPLDGGPASSGYRLLELRPPGQARIRKAGVRLDLGGIGKGFAADEALAVLHAMGLRKALVAVSGDIAIGDAPPGQAGWRVELAPGDTAATIELAGAGVSSSGQAGQGPHIVDARTGQRRPGLAVSIITARGVDADASATACVALGADACLEWLITRPGTSAVLFSGRHLRKVGVVFKKP